MSFWGATVITNLFSAIPLVGDSIVTLLWGGFSVDNPLLNRFFSLHYLLPFVIVGLVVLHIVALHQHGSNNPIGIDMKTDQDSLPFHPYYTIKDMLGLGAFLTFFAFFVFFAPNYFGEADNYIMADALQTPAHIVPEWYFLPYYAILRAFTADWFVYNILSLGGFLMTAKLMGVLAMFASILLLLFLPWLDGSKVKSSRFRPVHSMFVWIFVLDCIVLGICGAKPAEGMWLIIGQTATVYYFAHLLFIIPIVSRLERPMMPPESIAASVMTKAAA
tara:strand:- start:860 stop:1684 length:825 start_codon:yes stop_codon:yes gene_type:complete